MAKHSEEVSFTYTSMFNDSFKQIRSDIKSALNGIPTGIIIFLTFVYLVIVGTFIYGVEGVLLPILFGFSFYIAYMLVIKSIVRLMLRDKNEFDRKMSHLQRGLNRVAGTFIVWAILADYYPSLRLMDTNSVMSTSEKVQIVNALVIVCIGIIYLLWYIAFGYKEKVVKKTKKLPKIEN